jgi:uncharacterized protein (DUF1499 family)
MASWAICALGVLVGLGVSLTILFSDQSQLWLFAVIAILPFAVAAPMVINDLRYPRINDVTTNVDNPPEFVAALKASPNAGRNMSFPEGNRSIVQAKYPNIQPLILDASLELVFEHIEDSARSQTGWVITRCDKRNQILEGEVSTSFFRFVDDFIIQVTEQNEKARIDMRSKSREGLVDAGENAKRIQSFLSELLGKHQDT